VVSVQIKDLIDRRRPRGWYWLSIGPPARWSNY